MSAAEGYPSDIALLADDHEFLRREPAAGFWRLMPYYVPQGGSACCSVAAAAMVLNSLRSAEQSRSDRKVLTTDDLLRDSGSWAAAVGTNGNGVALQQLASLLRAALAWHEIDAVVELVEIPLTSGGMRRIVWALFAQVEQTEATLLIANFRKGTLLGGDAADEGHFAPIAAFDRKPGRVLLLDPDRDSYEPYWAPLDKLFEAMATRDKETDQPRGLLLVRHR